MTFREMQDNWQNGNRKAVAESLYYQTYDNLFRFVSWLLSDENETTCGYDDVPILAKLMDNVRSQKNND
jgi:hypothetical protein